MSSFPNSPKLIKGGLVLVDADTREGAVGDLAAVQHAIR